MARLFDDGDNEYLRDTNIAAIAHPYSLSAWFNTNDVTVNQLVLSIADADGTDYAGLMIRGGDAGDFLRAYSYDGAGNDSAISTVGVSINTWHHGLAVFAATDDREIWIDGGGYHTDGNNRAVTDIDAVAVGVSADVTPFGYMSGPVAEAAVWDVALTAADAAILASGYSPLFVRPQNLVFYVPLVRDNDEDIVGGISMTAFNAPTIASHPPVIRPASPFSAFGTAAAPPVGVAPTSHILGPLYGPLGGPI